MKKLLLLTGLAVTLAFNAQSQIKFGFRAGVTSSTIEADRIQTSDYDVDAINDSKIGLQAGIISQITVGGLFIQPELLLSTSGGAVRVRNLRDGTSQVKDQKFTKVDLPVLIGGKLGPLRLGVGPIASMVIKSKSELKDIDGFSDKFNKATFGYQAGVGLDIWKLAFDVKYEGNLSRLGSDVKIAGENYSFDSRTSQWVFGVALLF